MADEKMIAKEELVELIQIRDTANELIIFVGQLELQKTLVDADLIAAKQKYLELIKKESSLLQQLSEKYGSDAQINLETGTII